MNFIDNLSDAAKSLVEGKPEAKVQFIRSDCWLNTPDTKISFQWMEYLLRGARGLRPQCLQLIADAGMGKSATLESFQAKHPVVTTADPLRSKRPVLVCEASGESSGAKAVRQAIMKAAWPGAKDFRLTELELDDTLESQEVRVVLFDELGELFTAGRVAHRRALSELKRINNLGINLVATTVSKLSHVLSLDPQFATRFDRKITLPLWTESQDLRNFLFGFECRLPFAVRSHLDDRKRIKEFLAHAEGNTAKMLNHTRLAACWTVERGGRSISDDDFKNAREAPGPPPVALRVSI